MKQSLYDLTNDLLAIEEALTSGAENAEELIAQWVETNASVTDKIDAYAGLVRSKEAEAKMYAGEAERFTAKSQAAKGVADRLKAGLKFFLEAKGMDEVRGRLFTAKLQNNGGVQPVQTPLEPADLPQEFQRVRIEPDNTKIREALERGETVPGCELLPRGKHVRIN